MSAPIVSPQECCKPCVDAPVTMVPGPRGDPGTDGTNGTDGQNAFTVLRANFTIPAVSGSTVATVADSVWAGIGQTVFLESGGSQGYFIVTAKPDSTHITLQNPGYPDNSAPGTVIVQPGTLEPAGPRGATGASGGSITLNQISPTTTRGDLIVDNGATSPVASDVRFGVGTDGRTLHARSSQPTGLQWSDLDLSGTNSGLTGTLTIARGGTGQGTRQTALNALMPPAPVTGDLSYYDGANWTRLAMGTAFKALRVNASATALEYAIPCVLQRLSSNTVVASEITTTIPFDDTIPQDTEGTQLLTVGITPSSTTSKIIIDAIVPCSLNTATQIILALFKGAGNAIAAGFANQATAAQPNTIQLHHEFVPGATTPLTIALNIGSSAGDKLGINGTDAGAGVVRKFGGVLGAWLYVTEVT